VLFLVFGVDLIAKGIPPLTGWGSRMVLVYLLSLRPRSW